MNLERWTTQFTIFTVCVAILAAAQLATAPRPSERLGSMDARALQSFWSERIPQLMQEHGVEGASVLVLKDGAPVFSSAFGYADVADRRPLTTDAMMMAHSISKSVTAWGVMKLVQQGKIDLDAPVATYLENWQWPESPYRGDQVTVRRLLSLNAGVPLGALGVHLDPDEDLPELREVLRGDAVRLRRPPGSGFEYSNTSFAILELLIEEVSGRDFAAYMEDEVLAPLGMHRASFDWRDSWGNAVPTGYDLGGEPVPPYIYPNRASGGLFASLGDIGRFAAASLDPSQAAVLSPATVREMHSAQVDIPGMFGLVSDAYGLGHFLETLPDGHEAVWHGGQGLGWMTHFYVVPSTGDGIVLLANSQRSWPFFADVLNQWSTWAGIGRPGMGRIATATVAIRVLNGVLAVLALWLALRVAHGLAIGTRGFRARRRSTAVQIAHGVTGLSILAMLSWAAVQDYLFLSSIFPDDSLWLGASLLALAVTLLSAALFPMRRETRTARDAS